MRRYLILISDTKSLCGVEAFARNMAGALHERAQTAVLDANVWRLWRLLDSHDSIVLNFPVVAWKKKLLEPLLAAVTAKARRRQVTVILHEWASLDWKRRLVLLPVMLLADSILCSAPEIRGEWAAQQFGHNGSARTGLIPIPPNVIPPKELPDGQAARLIRAKRKPGQIVLGQFGSIYPKKNCAELLAIADLIRTEGQDVLVVFVGSFIKAMDNVEEDFKQQVSALGMEDNVLVTGYIGSDEDVFAALNEVDVFCYKFHEGLTSRRGSVLAAALTGHVVVCNAPATSTALDHHGLFRALISNGNIVLCPHEADKTAMAAAVRAAGTRTPPATFDIDHQLAIVWSDILATVDKAQAD